MKRHALEFGADATTPRQYFRGYKIDEICGGGTHFMALSEKRIYTWGKGKVGQLGFGDIVQQNKPKQLIIGEATNFTFVRCGPLQSAAISESGQLYLWGVLSTGPTFFPTPQILPNHKKVLSMDFGPSCTVALLQHKPKILTGPQKKNKAVKVDTRTEVWVWGSALKNQMGLGEVNDVRQPTEIIQLRNERICQISVGETHMAALSDTGRIYLWGDNENNILGLGEGSDTSFPRELVIPDYFIIALECGFRHTFALTSQNQILSWGYSRHGVLGTGSEKTITEPTLITQFYDGELEMQPKIIKISSGGMHAAALSDNGDVYTWGEGRSFKTCKNTEADVLVPTKVSHDLLRITTNVSCSGAATILLQGFTKITISFQELKIEFDLTPEIRNEELYNLLKKFDNTKGLETFLVTSNGSEVPRSGLFSTTAITLRKPRLYVVYYEKLLWSQRIGRNDDSFGSIRQKNEEHTTLVFATPQRFIFWLLFPSPYGNESKVAEMIEIFFTSYKICTKLSDTQLLHQIFQEYLNTDSLSYLKMRKTCGIRAANMVRFRLLNLLQEWIRLDPTTFYDSNAGFMASFNHFLQKKVFENFPAEVKQISLQIRLQQRKKRLFSFPPFPFRSLTHVTYSVMKTVILDSYVQMAQQITLIDHWILQQVSIDEISRFLQSSITSSQLENITIEPNTSEWPGISQILLRAATVRDWVATQILSSSNPFRLSIFEFFVALCRSLYEDCRNYQSAYSVFLGLSSAPVYHVLSASHAEFVTKEVSLLSGYIESRDQYSAEDVENKPAHILCLVRFLETLIRSTKQQETTEQKTIEIMSIRKFYQMIQAFQNSKECEFTYKQESIRITYLLNIHGLAPSINRAVASVLSSNQPQELTHQPTFTCQYLKRIVPSDSMYDSTFTYYLNKVSAGLLLLDIEKRMQQIHEWNTRLRESGSMHEVAPHPLTFLLGEKESKNTDSGFSCGFKEIFLRSNAFENTLFAIVKEYPAAYEDIVQKFLSECLMPSVNGNLLMKVLYGLSFSTLSLDTHITLVKVIATFRNYKFTQHNDGLKQCLRAISSDASRLSIARNSISVSPGSDPKTFIARSLQALSLGGDLMNSHLCVQRILKEQNDYLHNAMKILESDEFKLLTEQMSQLKSSIDDDNEQENEKTIKGEDFIPLQILEVGVVQQNELQEIEVKRNELLARLRKVKEKISYSKDTIAELDCKMINAQSSFSKDLDVLEEEIKGECEKLKVSKGQSSADQFQKFVQDDHKGVIEEMKRDAENIELLLNSVEPSLIKNLTTYIDLQITFLTHLKDILDEPSTTEEEKMKYREIIETAEKSSHSFGEILSVLEQQKTEMNFTELVVKVNQKLYLQQQVRNAAEETPPSTPGGNSEN